MRMFNPLDLQRNNCATKIGMTKKTKTNIRKGFRQGNLTQPAHTHDNLR